jgi:hypothetical protein
MMRKFGKGMADKMGRAMKGPTADMAGRAMVAPPNRMNRPAEPGMGYKKGGEIKDSKKMAKKEIAFMKKKGAPKSMIKHEKAEYGMKKGGMASSYRKGADGITAKGKTKGKMVKMAYGGKSC